jgi:hypothetical protein
VKDFWTWATVHWWLTFILAWITLWAITACVTSFFQIFHRAPRVVNEEQLDEIRRSVAERLDRLEGSGLHLTEAQVNAMRNANQVQQTAARPASPWYERL